MIAPRMFQSTPLREGRQGNSGVIAAFVEFQSTPLREGRPGAHAVPWAWRFQSTPLREGRHRLSGHAAAKREFQSTPLREGRRADDIYNALRMLVSIHAPARGATMRAEAMKIGLIEFQSTPLREGRHGGHHRDARADLRFNPRPCARGDTRADGEVRQIDCVSIHAPARGATRTGRHSTRVLRFQSTPLREGRPGRQRRRGARARVSIHAPARGATSGRLTSPVTSLPFQSTPLREGRPRCCTVWSLCMHARASVRRGRWVVCWTHLGILPWAALNWCPDRRVAPFPSRCCGAYFPFTHCAIVVRATCYSTIGSSCV